MQITIRNTNNLPTIDYRTVKAFQGNLKDAKDHEKLLRVLQKRGFDIPLILWFKSNNAAKGAAYLLDGHQRQTVMVDNDVNDNGNYEVPYIRIDAATITEAKARLLEITSQYGTITEQGLREYLQAADLPVAETLELVSFDALPDLDTVFGDGSESEEEDEGESDDDTSPEADTTTPPKSEPGVVYQLGPHRLLCGDATNLGAVSELMDGAIADLIWTDPPYNVEYVGKTKDKLTIQNDKQSDEGFYQFLLDAFTNMAMVTREGGGNLYLSCRQRRPELPQSNDGRRVPAKAVHHLEQKQSGHGSPRLPVETRTDIIRLERGSRALFHARAHPHYRMGRAAPQPQYRPSNDEAGRPYQNRYTQQLKERAGRIGLVRREW